MVLAACSSPETTAPSQQAPPLDFPAGSSGGGQVNETSALVGTWQRFDVFSPDSGDDLVTQTTQWQFDAAGGCQRVITTTSAVEGIPRTTIRDCTFTLGVQEITLSWSDGAVQTFTLTFAAFDPDRLVLDGFEYQRLS